MKRIELASKIAARDRVTRAEARDQVDEVVRGILKSLRRGRAVELQGVGLLVADSPQEKSRKK